ncbi:MAG: aldehyde dehydrogenase family protein [Polyangiales bacterium]
MTQAVVAKYGSAAIPEAEHRIEPTSQATLDEALAILQDHKAEWAALDIDERISLLETLRDGVVGVAQRWVDASVEAKGLQAGSGQEGEEWLGGVSLVVRNISLLIESLRDVVNHGAPQLPKKAYARPNGQVAAPVFPTDLWDGLLFQGFTAEVWMDPDVKLEDLPRTQAGFYREPSHTGRVSLVLGAGNVSSIGPMDTLYKMFVEGQVVILKMNPVNEYLGPIIDEAFAPLRDRGYFRLVYGGATEGKYLCQHELVEEMHITGSDKTHDAIVFGVGEDGATRKANRQPLNSKHITSELGNVSPIIIVPGPWSTSDIEFQSINIASSLVNNAGYNCTATRVIIQHEQWDQRETFLNALKGVFAREPDRKPYYPGAEDRQQAFMAKHPEGSEFGSKGPGKAPWTLIDHLDPSNRDDICFTTESWCGLSGEVALPSESVAAYVDRAVDFANDACWGTLSATIIVHPKSLKDPAVADAVERAVANLRFGSVAVNHWAALAYGLVTPTWGAFPGHPIEDIGSGQGVVHNTYLFDRPQKAVVRGPFRVFPKPAWFITNKTAADIGRKLTYFYADPSVTRIPSILVSALKG